MVRASMNLGLWWLSSDGYFMPSFDECRPYGAEKQVPGGDSVATFGAVGSEWIEVIRLSMKAFHRGSREGAVEQMRHEGGPSGCWFLAQRGTGIFLPSKRVLRVSNRSQLAVLLHIEGYEKFGVKWVKLSGKAAPVAVQIEDAVPLCPHAQARGFDTLVIGPKPSPMGTIHHEVVDCSAEATRAIVEGPCVGGLRTGWRASLPCQCDDSLSILNCLHTGEKELPWPRDAPVKWLQGQRRRPHQRKLEMLPPCRVGNNASGLARRATRPRARVRVVAPERDAPGSGPTAPRSSDSP
mmetsp:Transcript_27524/g.64242  ORF Transcript_27524/g.64242 Transcript_27524/m.64242 type:complete len:295 (+) Transcript_27524:811-1695(+)